MTKVRLRPPSVRADPRSSRSTCLRATHSHVGRLDPGAGRSGGQLRAELQSGCLRCSALCGATRRAGRARLDRLERSVSGSQLWPEPTHLRVAAGRAELSDARAGRVRPVVRLPPPERRCGHRTIGRPVPLGLTPRLVPDRVPGGRPRLRSDSLRLAAPEYTKWRAGLRRRPAVAAPWPAGSAVCCCRHSPAPGWRLADVLTWWLLRSRAEKPSQVVLGLQNAAP